MRSAGPKRVVVIGATGTVGREVVAQLTAAGADVCAVARNVLPGQFAWPVRTARADVTQPDTLDRPLEDADAVFVVWRAPKPAALPALTRICERVERVVLLSSPYKVAHPMFQQPNASASLDAHLEHVIESSAREWTFLRPGMFAANSRHWWGAQFRGRMAVRWPYLEVHTAPTDERDIAAVAVRALTDDGHARAEYVITGPESLSQFDQISTIARALGRPVEIREISRADARRELGMPEPVADMLLNAWAAAAGCPAHVTNTVEQVTGVPARSFQRWATDHVDEFR